VGEKRRVGKEGGKTGGSVREVAEEENDEEMVKT
jgi:hypothetical protein